MDANNYGKYRQALLDEESALNTTIEAVQGGGLAEPMKNAISELSSYDNHPADLGTEMFERSKDLSLRDSAFIQKARIREALERIENGTYGHCERCGKDIPEERLEAFPAAALCIDCKKEEEELSDRHIRPIEEDVLFSPFARSFTGDQNNNAYDGEDAWQEVAQYGTSESPSDIWEPGEFYEDNNLGSDRVAVMPDADEDIGNVVDVDSIAVENAVDDTGDEIDGIHYGADHGKKR